MGDPNPKIGLHGRLIVPTLDDAIQELGGIIDEQIQPNLAHLLAAAPAGKPGHLGIGPAGGLRWRKAIYLTYMPNGEIQLGRDRRGKKPITTTTRADFAGHIRDWATTHW